MYDRDEITEVRVVVVGDVMLDRYIYGEATRLSPEAPVPVVDVIESTCTLGGAGNVALNVAGLGARTWLIGLVGDDSDGCVVQQIASDNVVAELIIDRMLRTTTKTRVMAGRYQLVRFDEEGRRGSSQSDVEIINRFYSVIDTQRPNAVIISDYDKGVITEAVCTEIITACNLRGIRVLVDPKRTDWGLFAEATLIKPNLYELSVVAGRKVYSFDEIVKTARELLRQCIVQYILVTMGDQGMIIVSSDESVYVPPFVTREVYDVSGAGDTVIATVAVYWSLGMSLQGAVTMAAKAGSVVVGKVGTQAISRAEIE